MIAATEQQLTLVTRRTQRLEQTLAAQIEDMKRIKADVETAQSDVQQLRAALADAENREQQLQAAKEEAAAALKQSALEYSKAQLLRKKYRNTLAELQGHGRAFAVLQQGFDAADGGQPRLVIADECTINAPTSGKAFTLDGVLVGQEMLQTVNEQYTQESNSAPPQTGPDALGIRGAVDDALKGFNVTYFTLGPSKSGKSTLMWGDENPAHASPGLVQTFLNHLFYSMEDHEVTHFNMRMSMGECHMEQFYDLLVDYSAVLNIGRGGAVAGGQGPIETRAVGVQSAEDAIALLQSGVKRHRGGKRQRGHVFLALVIENFNVRGHFRKSTVMFVDVAGVPAGASVMYGPEHQWLHRSLSSLCSTIAQLSQQQQQQQRRSEPSSGVSRLLGEALGGNCKAVMVVTLGAPSHTTASSQNHQQQQHDAYLDEALGSLTYAHHFKSVLNHPVPHDIPAELQKLSMELREAGEDDDGEMPPGQESYA